MAKEIDGMNRELYYGLISYLGSRRLPDILCEFTRLTVKQTWQQFRINDNNDLFKKEKTNDLLVVPEHKITEVMRLAYNHPLAGHAGIKNTYYRLRQTHWWPGISEDIRRHIQSCDKCQKQKTDKQTPLMSSARIVAEPWYHFGIDIIGPLPITQNGNRYVVLAVDFFMKYVEARPLTQANAQAIAEFIHEDIICQHGVPREMTSDRGTEFVNQLLTELEKKYKIKHIKTTAYHPQGNGQTERMNKTFKTMIAKTLDKYDHWDYYVNSVLFAMRTIRNESTKFSPFELIYGRNPRREFSQETLTFGKYEDCIWQWIDQDITRLHKTREAAAKFISQSQDQQRKHQNKDNKIMTEKIVIGDKVLLFRDIVESSWSKKLEQKWEGPYLIQQIKGTSIWLRRLDGTIRLNSVHQSKIKKYHERPSY